MSPKPVFLDRIFFDEIDRMFSESAKVIDKEGELKDKEVEKSINLLALARNAKREVDSAYKLAVKPIKDQLVPFDTERKAKNEKLDMVDERIGGALLARLREKRELPAETAAGVKLTVVGRKRPVLNDINKVPAGFFLPREECINWAMVADALNRGKPVPGIEMAEDFSLRTTLPEIIE